MDAYQQDIDRHGVVNLVTTAVHHSAVPRTQRSLPKRLQMCRRSPDGWKAKRIHTTTIKAKKKKYDNKKITGRKKKKKKNPPISEKEEGKR